MNRLFARLMSGAEAFLGLPDPLIQDYPARPRRHPLDPSALGLPRAWGKPGSRRRSPRTIAGRWVLIDEPRFAMLKRMPRQKARHWLSHNRNKAPRCLPAVSGR